MGTARSDGARTRWRLRPLSLAVLVGVTAVSVAGCLVTRSVVDDQEHRLLDRSTNEAALYLGAAVSGLQPQLGSLAAGAALTKENADAFTKSARFLTSSAAGFSTVALVKIDPTPAVESVAGAPLPATGLDPAAMTAITRAYSTRGIPTFVATRLFTRGSDHVLGFAYAGPVLSDAVVYAESVVKTTTSASTSGAPFSELVAAVYASPTAQPDQVFAVSAGAGALPLRGHTAQTTVDVGTGKWLIVAKARHTLVGDVAVLTPWGILLAGLLGAVLATIVVETLGRRRDYAEELVAERTAELERSLEELADAHDQLVRSERLAAIGELASAVGHELRNPLGVLSNAAYLLRADLGDAPTDAAQRHLATVDREISAATLIVSDLLEFARQRDPAPVDTDMVALAEEALSVQPPPTGTTVALHRPEDGGVVARLDRDMLRQVLLNLVGNAYQAMPNGGAVDVTVEAVAGATRVVVRDTGVGMDADTAARVFEPFFTTKARGVGLGLAVTRRLVEAHGGRIEVASTPGEGATFTVTLPQVVPPRQAPDRDSSLSQARA